LDAMIVKRGYKRGYCGTYIMPGDFIPDED